MRGGGGRAKVNEAKSEAKQETANLSRDQVRKIMSLTRVQQSAKEVSRKRGSAVAERNEPKCVDEEVILSNWIQ